MDIQNLIDRHALFVVNHSGGKDSQAMLLKIRQRVPDDQILVIHATLGRVEWGGVISHILNNIDTLSFAIAENRNKDFLGMVRNRGKWPSPQQRQCTSDLKRGPIEREIRHYLKRNPQFNGLVVNCMGLRAQESSVRAKRAPFKFNARNSKAGREWYDWLPIQDMLEEQVFQTISDYGQSPHWAYAAGMSRLSCVFCIMASKSDLCVAAKLNPELYREYVNLEKEINHTFIMPRKGQEPIGLEEYTGIKAN